MRHAQTRTIGRAIVLAAALALAVSTVGYAWVGTDLQDYTPGSVVTLSGGNDASGAPGYTTGHIVSVDVTADNSLWEQPCSAMVAGDGTWSCQVTLSSDPAVAAGSYHYAATSDDASGIAISETGTFTDASAPVSAVSFPVAGTYYNNAGWDAGCTAAGFCGTASQHASSGDPTGVRLQIQRGTGTGATYWNGSSWVSDNSTTVTATISGSDATVNWSYGFGHATFPAEDRYSISSSATDGTNTESLGGGSAFYIDNTAPSSSITCNAAVCSGTYSGTVTVGLSATDPALGTTGRTGSGVYQIKYTTDGTTTPDVTHGTVYTGTFSLSSATTVKYAAIDNAGNVESAHTQTITFASANHPPTDPGIPALQSLTMTPNNSGNFAVVWTASTDPDLGDTVTYELQKHDYSTSSWTSVQSGLTANSKQFSGEGQGSWSYRVQASDNHGATSSWVADSSPIVVVDTTPPSAPTAAATTSSVYTDGSGNNWWKDTVTVSFSDNGDPNLPDGSAGSGVDSSTLTGNQTFTTQGLHTASGTVKDYAKNESTAGTLAVYVDNAVPTFGACPVAGPFLLGSGDHSVGPISALDVGGSGVDSSTSTLSGTVHTHTIGTKAVTFTAYDNVGHSATTTCNYDVIYDFTGFFQPVDNNDVCNVAKAGSAVPVKFSLDGYQGMNIIAAGYPKALSGTCSGSALVSIEETVTAGQSSLNYDPTTDQYIYVWKTDKTWAGKAIKLDVELADGTHHYARFTFTK